MGFQDIKASFLMFSISFKLLLEQTNEAVNVLAASIFFILLKSTKHLYFAFFVPNAGSIFINGNRTKPGIVHNTTHIKNHW